MRISPRTLTSSKPIGTKPTFAIAEIAAYFAILGVRFSALSLLRRRLEPPTLTFDWRLVAGDYRLNGNLVVGHALPHLPRS